MRIDDILERKRVLLTQRREEEAREDPDEFALALVDEELRDLNAELRTLRGAPRSGGKTNSAMTMDRAQYEQWRISEQNEETHDARRVYFETLEGGADALTERQREVFEAWRDGASIKEIAARFGIDRSTVSRTLARAKARMREEAARLGKEFKLAGMTVFDLADRGVAGVILSCLTARQAVCIYLYYGEWLSLRECAELLDVDHTAVLRMVQRGLRAIQDTLRCESFTLDNADALSEIAYELYVENGLPSVQTAGPITRAGAWGRRAMGYRPSRNSKIRPAECVVRTSDGLTSEGGAAHRSADRPMSRLLRLLYELRLSRSLFGWLRELFAKFTKK